MTQRTDLERYRRVVPDWRRFTEAASREEPTVLRVRRGRISEDDLVRRLGRRGFRLRPVEGLPGFLQVEDGPGPVSLTLEHWLGLFYVQQASTGLAAPALGARPGERVLDLCAAPGGKTTHLAELMDDRGCLVASEVSEGRIRGLLGNVYRLAHTNVLAVAADGRSFPAGALFDRVLVDAPCSGEGTLRRRSGKVPRQSRGFLSYVTGAQRALLERAVRLTRPGGTILYVTCTFAPEENEAVVSDVLARTPVDVEPLAPGVPHEPGLVSFEGARYDERVEGAVRIYPHHLDSGGLFMARLRRLEEGEGAPALQKGRTDEGHAAGRLGRAPGWSPVPAAFPEPRSSGDESPREGAASAGAGSADDAKAVIERATLELRERWGMGEDDIGGVRWIVRGGRLWLHTVDAWPLPSWEAGEWRAVSLGLRAAELDSKGRVRPTNDFLRWAGSRIRERVVDVERDALAALLRREAVPAEGPHTVEDREGERLLGPVAIRFEGEVIGRGASTAQGLVGEIPKARASDLGRALERE